MAKLLKIISLAMLGISITAPSMAFDGEGAMPPRDKTRAGQDCLFSSGTTHIPRGTSLMIDSPATFHGQIEGYYNIVLIKIPGPLHIIRVKREVVRFETLANELRIIAASQCAVSMRGVVNAPDVEMSTGGMISVFRLDDESVEEFRARIRVSDVASGAEFVPGAETQEGSETSDLSIWSEDEDESESDVE